jgi:DamX protein
MQNKVIKQGKVQNYPIAKKANTWLSMINELLIRTLILIAGVITALIISSYIWPNRFLPSSPAEVETTEEISEPIVEISQPLPSLVPAISAVESEFVFLSQIPSINQELAKKPSQIPGWQLGVVRELMQPSSKQVIALADFKNVKDNVIENPKILPRQSSVQVAKPAQVDHLKRVKRKMTIQLLASRKQEYIKSFMSAHHLNKVGKIWITKRDGLEWYVLTIGEYGDLEQAQTVIKNLAPDLQKLKPWVRPVGQLKEPG